jgi:hypothetical protein
MSCSNCNQNNCSQTKCNCSGPTRYNGPNVDCVGLTNGTSYDAVIQQLAEFMCNIEFEDGVGISEVIDNQDGTITFVYTDGSTTIINVNSGVVVSDIINNGDNTITVEYTDGSNSIVNITPNTIVEGDDDIVVTSSTAPNGDITYTVSRPKEFLYEETISSIDISIDPGFSSLVYFQPTGYTNLIYTNTTSSTKTYKVHAFYEFSIGDITPNNALFASWVDAAIVKNSTPIYEVYGQINISSYLFWGPNSSDLIGTGLPLHSLLDDQGSDVDVRFATGQIPLNSSFFKVVTLNPGETVSLEFRTKDPTVLGEPPIALLRKAQFMVDEV